MKSKKIERWQFIVEQLGWKIRRTGSSGNRQTSLFTTGHPWSYAISEWKYENVGH